MREKKRKESEELTLPHDNETTLMKEGTHKRTRKESQKTHTGRSLCTHIQMQRHPGHTRREGE
jgi:hypothetical protein